MDRGGALFRFGSERRGLILLAASPFSPYYQDCES
jgi:hypothetical protein